MEISNFNTFYNINNNTLTVGKRNVKFLNLLDKSITNFFLDKYVYVGDSLKTILTNSDNEHLFTIDNFGTLEELIKFVLNNDKTYKQTKEVKMIAVMSFSDLDKLDEKYVFELLTILNFSHLNYPIRFFFYAEELFSYKNKFWFDTIINCIDDVAIGNIEDKDALLLLEENIINEKNLSELKEKEDSLLFKSRV